ncbi:hypothetical protein [Novipirellula aureliae]|nr:hypothetical protein [Novipirellula aureliae]
MRRLYVAVIIVVAVFATASTGEAADYRTRNFLVQAPNAQLARTVGDAAERYRDDLSQYWLGRRLPPWSSPCPVRVVAGNLPAQGVTTYNRSPVRDFQMEVVGTPERILDSVLPHEVTHTVLATHFGRPLPRWADEGIATTVEHPSERQKHEHKLREFLRTRRGIPMNKLFLLTEYPSDVLPMYAQGYSVCSFLIEQRDPETFIAFLEDYMKHPSWTSNIQKHYGYDSLAELQDYWLSWVADGSGPVEKFAKNSALPTNSVQPLPQAIRSNPQPGRPIGSVASNATTATAPGSTAPGSTAPATTLASTEPGGWYMRQKREAGKQPSNDRKPEAIASESSNSRLMPPSVRNNPRYMSAQPQPEQGMSRPSSIY